MELAAYRVFQEALTNALRHARATRLALEMRHDADAVVVSLTDDGRGFEPRHADRASAGGQHLGLVSMRERAAFIGAELEVRSAPGKGTTVRLRVPLRAAGDAGGGSRPRPPASGHVMSHTVLLADDHTLVRAGLRALLEGLPEVSAVLEASDGREALAAIAEHRPAVVIMDIGMPGLNGLEAAAVVSRDHPATRTIMLSMHGTDAYVLQALRAGAAGYLLKDAAVAELPLALRAVLRGEIYISSAVSRVVVSGFLAGMAAAESPRAPSTASARRQREILQLIAEGRSTKEIAFSLKLSVKTVETHRRQVMERLQIFDVPGLVRFALRHGIVSE